MNSTITAMHYCLPTKRLTNDELVERFGAQQLRSIIKMVGINERRVVQSGVTAADLAYQAARGLITDRKIDPASIDLLIFASQTGDYQIPATACVMHQRLGLAENCAAFDINLGCSSFPYSMSVAHGMIVAGIARRALVLNADAITMVIHPMDRGLVPLHGDAAVATLVEPCSDGDGFMGFELGTDGSGYAHLLIPASGARMSRSADTKKEIKDESGIIRTQEHLYMNGPAVFHFSLHKVPAVIKAMLDRFHFTVADLDLVILHQANRTMVDMIYRALEVPAEKRFYFSEMVGNASGASSPMVLAEAWRQGRVRLGSYILLAAFGNGLSWGITIIHWPDNMGPAVMSAVDYQEQKP